MKLLRCLVILNAVLAAATAEGQAPPPEPPEEVREEVREEPARGDPDGEAPARPGAHVRGEPEPPPDPLRAPWRGGPPEARPILRPAATGGTIGARAPGRPGPAEEWQGFLRERGAGERPDHRPRSGSSDAVADEFEGPVRRGAEDGLRAISRCAGGNCPRATTTSSTYVGRGGTYSAAVRACPDGCGGVVRGRGSPGTGAGLDGAEGRWEHAETHSPGGGRVVRPGSPRDPEAAGAALREAADEQAHNLRQRGLLPSPPQSGRKGGRSAPPTPGSDRGTLRNQALYRVRKTADAACPAGDCPRHAAHKEYVRGAWASSLDGEETPEGRRAPVYEAASLRCGVHGCGVTAEAAVGTDLSLRGDARSTRHPESTVRWRAGEEPADPEAQQRAIDRAIEARKGPNRYAPPPLRSGIRGAEKLPREGAPPPTPRRGDLDGD